MTKIDFKDTLTEYEYKVLGNFLSSYVKPIGSKMVTMKCKTKKYNNMRVSVNTYDSNEILKKAEERLLSNKITITRRETLSRVIAQIKGRKND